MKKGLLLLANKLTEKVPYSCNAKEHFQSFIRNKNIKSVKQLKIITHRPKTFENQNMVDTKSIIMEHPKTLHKLSKTISLAEKVGSNSSLYNNAEK